MTEINYMDTKISLNKHPNITYSFIIHYLTISNTSIINGWSLFCEKILYINLTKWCHKCTEDWYFFLVLYWPDHCLLWCQQLCVVLWLVAVVRIHQGLPAGQAENQYWSRPPKLVLVVWVPAHIFSKVCPLFSSTRWRLTCLPACTRCAISGPCVEHTATELLPK